MMQRYNSQPYIFFYKLLHSDVRHNTEEKICRYFCLITKKWTAVITLQEVFQLDGISIVLIERL